MSEGRNFIPWVFVVLLNRLSMGWRLIGVIGVDCLPFASVGNSG